MWILRDRPMEIEAREPVSPPVVVLALSVLFVAWLSRCTSRGFESWCRGDG